MRDRDKELAWAQREAELARREVDLATQRQRYSEEHARMAKRAAAVNVKSSPGHGTNPKTMDDTLREVAARHFN